MTRFTLKCAAALVLFVGLVSCGSYQPEGAGLDHMLREAGR